MVLHRAFKGSPGGTVKETAPKLFVQIILSLEVEKGVSK